ncbi:MAG TPA: dipeptidase [Thermoguttaceae bacterium]|mgnify:CR=1 FL=1|nr:dipeptidase [Thermoguttaceae bacterium]
MAEDWSAELRRAAAYVEAHAADFEQRWAQWLRIPSISADPAHRPDLERAADWLLEQFRGLGLTAEKIPTAGAPLVYAESPPVQGAPTALVYGHYDVQPAEPIQAWESPPFEPTRRNGAMYARGATDDKGQLLTHLWSTEAWLRAVGRLPVQLKFLIEGEEEIGSSHLEQFLRDRPQRAVCDCVVISDGAQFGPDQPAICYGLRGIAYYELRLKGPKRDLHSGSFGGTVTNPANALAQMLAGLVDERGRIQIPGFYDDVTPLSAEERERLASLPFDEEKFLADLGVSGATGEEGYTLLERRWARPTFDIHGLWSGYQGEGAKTVLPAEAGAKFSFRLVPYQDPAKITLGLRQRLQELCPPGIQMELLETHGTPAVLAPVESPYVQAAVRAIQQAFGRPPVFIREGGSIPIVAAFQQAFPIPVLLVGWGQDDDNTHAPNERLRLVDFHRGIQASIYLWAELALAFPRH